MAYTARAPQLAKTNLVEVLLIRAGRKLRGGALRTRGCVGSRGEDHREAVDLSHGTVHGDHHDGQNLPRED
jgi:hypothetical protein